MKEDNIIKLRTDWIQDFSSLINKMVIEFENLGYLSTRSHFSEKIDLDKLEEYVAKLFRHENDLRFKVTIEGETYFDLYTHAADTRKEYRIFSIKEFSNESEYEQEHNRLTEKQIDFQLKALVIIKEQTKKLTE